MSERGWLFLFNLFCILLALGGSGFLIVSGQAVSVEGMFLLMTCGVVVLVSVLSVRFLLKD